MYYRKYRKRGSASYIVREWLLWVVLVERERERERERDACDVIDITLKSRVIMHMITVQQKIFVSEKFRQKLPSAVRQEFIFVKRRITRFVFGRSVRLLIVSLPIHDYFWSHRHLSFWGKFSQEFNLGQKIALTKATKLNSWRKFSAVPRRRVDAFRACHLLSARSSCKDEELGAWALDRAAGSSDWGMRMGKWKLCVRWSACRGSPCSISLACFKQEE